MVKQRKVEFETHMAVERRHDPAPDIEWVFDTGEVEGAPGVIAGRFEVAYVNGADNVPEEGAFLLMLPLRNLNTDETRIETIGMLPADMAAISELFGRLVEMWKSGTYEGGANVGNN